MSVDVPQAPRTEAPAGSRAEAFREQIAEMKIPTPNAGRDQLLARVGGLIAAVGIALGVIGYFLSSGTNNTLDQNDALVLAVLGISCAVVGSAIFLRYSLAGFLRLWLVRLIHEQHRQDQ
jgi:hypothetical protein